ncbi:hypothetical protein CONLIGDRAFT_306840 [Coniochaeta ligniaria NRRL 30616]|uniref:Uncharacterized protein n=1 Tax=Coniochaeta ligniaria NRRL 30616 TaxID=1408157 RepID=A0A1J7JPH7_9PEZI|nr:hypothetical protein CONLIGDRAFT_306840 [Coniochaeta ligniaria NRRL 30616]
MPPYLCLPARRLQTLIFWKQLGLTKPRSRPRWPLITLTPEPVHLASCVISMALEHSSTIASRFTNKIGAIWTLTDLSSETPRATKPRHRVGSGYRLE